MHKKRKEVEKDGKMEKKESRRIEKMIWCKNFA